MFDLLWYQEMSQAEAAALLGVAVPTVKLRWMKARLRLPAELRPRAREGLRPLRGFARMAHGLPTTAPAPPGDTPQAPPDTPRFRFEAILARGGMGEVWRGCDTVLAREVALKVLHEQVFSDGGARGRFEEEARHVSRLEHPSIVPVYDLVSWRTGGRSS